MPEFDEFWAEGVSACRRGPTREILMAGLPRRPGGCAAADALGRIELFSETIAAFGYDDCPGHPAWLEPAEWLGRRSRRAIPCT